MKTLDDLLAKSEKYGKITLVQHLKDVASIAVQVAKNMGLNPEIAYQGAILHDIGKASPVFQKLCCQVFNVRQDLFFDMKLPRCFLSHLLKK